MNHDHHHTALFVVGFYAPGVLQICVMLSFLLSPWGAPPRLGLAAWFLGGSVISVCLNLLLKKVIQDPRPIGWNAAGKYIESGGLSDQWGMPSGHMQMSAFTLAFWYFAVGERSRSSLTSGVFGVAATILLFITAVQRYVYRKHNVMQLLAGVVVGTMLAYGIVTQGAHKPAKTERDIRIRAPY